MCNLHDLLIWKAESASEKQDWMKAIKTQQVNYVPQTLSAPRKAQKFVKQIFDSNAFQIFGAVLVLVNFLCNATEAEVNPEKGSTWETTLANFDIAFAVLFTIELSINIFANWFKTFIYDAWNWFDTIVVVASLFDQFVSDENSALSVLRLVRAFRVFRLFKRLKSLRQILRAVTQSLPAVCNAFFLVILMTMIYAIMGVSFLRNLDDVGKENFGMFSISMYTMFLIMTFDNSAGLCIDLMAAVEGGLNKFLVCLFVVSFQVIVAFILCNIVMAVLLDKFVEASEEAKAEDAEAALGALAKRMNSSLDPLLCQLGQIETEVLLGKRILELFAFLDEDHNGLLDFKELRCGFKRLEMDPPIDFKQEEYDNMMVKKGFCDRDGQIDIQGFKVFLDMQLKEYVQKQMALAAEETKPQEKLTAILRSLQQIAFVTCTTQVFTCGF